MSPPRFVLLSREDVDPDGEKASKERLKDWLRANTTGKGTPQLFLAFEATCLYEALMDRGPWTQDRLEHVRQELEVLPLGGGEEIALGRESAILELTRACECPQFLRYPLNEFMATIPHVENSHRFLFIALAFVLLLSAPVGSLDADHEVVARRPA